MMRILFLLRGGLASIILLASLHSAARPAGEVLDVGNRRQLLFDTRFVRESTNLQWVTHPPVKTGEVTIGSTPECALGGYHSVLFLDGAYHLWYMAGQRVHYARSSDGIHWEKPPLNLLKEAGENARHACANVVLGGGLGGVKGGMHGLMVFLDPSAPATERLKLVANPEEFGSKIQVWASPDGIQWNLRHKDVIAWKGNQPHLDSQNVIFWDERLRKYTAFYRLKLRQQGSPMRVVARAVSEDFGHFPAAEDGQVVMRSDTEHPGHRGPQGGKISVLDTYTNGTFKYPAAEDAYFMFPTDYYHYNRTHGEFRDEMPANAGVLDTWMAVSRDGVAWNRAGDRPFIPLGLKGRFDCARTYVVYGVVPGREGRELYMYYLGTSATHGWGRDDKNDRLLANAGLAPAQPSAISRVVIRKDGFVSVFADRRGGEFTTPPLKFNGDQLLLNVNTSASGEVRVELLDADSQPVPGFALDDCDVVHSANEIDRAVSWRRQTSLSRLAGKPVKLRFTLRAADLYAFQFAERGGI